MHSILFLLVFISVAQAGPAYHRPDECSPVDLRNQTLGSVRNQKKVSWCYSFTAADMLGYSFGLQQRLSAADLAINYNESGIGRFARWLDVNVISPEKKELRQLAHQTGFTKIALERSFRKGVCPEEIFPSEAWIKRLRQGDEWVEASVPLDAAMIDIARLYQQRGLLTAQNIPYYFSFKNIDEKVFIDLLKARSLAEVFSRLRATACKDDRFHLPDAPEVRMSFKNSKIFKTVSDKLQEGTVVAMDYDSRILASRASRGVKLSELHTSVLVGRRWSEESKTCQFLIRNSHGEKCAKYDPSYSCEAGHIWVDEGLLYPSITSIVYMEAANQ